MGSCCGLVFPYPEGSDGAQVRLADSDTGLLVAMSRLGPQRLCAGQWQAPTPALQAAASPSVKWAETVLGVLACGVTQPSDLACPGTGPHAQKGQAEAQEGWDPQGCPSRRGAYPRRGPQVADSPEQAVPVL